ncbi:MAG: dTDP-4-amino-4,6-dideoxygalactose transaminase [Erysipelotrichaceae bacterium]|nr:dTDP-4-amino-4,6-dideoxygalactose transaminase [Erysipelotrichaceae bacterium]
MIPFNVPPYVDGEEEYVRQSIQSHKICGDNHFTFECQKLMEQKFHSRKIHLTTSGTAALEMACMLADIQPGDEVILPSFTFSSTANAIVIFGGVPVFVDIKPDTKNIDENKIEAAITHKTKAIMVVHYAGIGCEMNKINEIAKKHDLLVIEDAAQGVDALYEDQYLGTIGDIGCYSFHETKNYSMGEGGAVSINNPELIDRSSVIREKGTNRTQFLNGQVDKYTWIDKGSSYLPSDILAAYLYPQLLKMDEIRSDRVDSFNRYMEKLMPLKEKDLIDLPYLPKNCTQNGHMFYVMTKDIDERARLQRFLKENDVISAFHYIPLHSAPEGIKAGRFVGDDIYTTNVYERLLRLPMYYGLAEEDLDTVCSLIYDFYQG